MKYLLITCCTMVSLMSCNNNDNTNKPSEAPAVKLVTLDPGHFHAALVQKKMYEGVDSVVAVYAPAGSDLELHSGRISAYNGRPESPTHWKEELYTGPDFLKR